MSSAQPRGLDARKEKDLGRGGINGNCGTDPPAAGAGAFDWSYRRAETSLRRGEDHAYGGRRPVEARRASTTWAYSLDAPARLAVAVSQGAADDRREISSTVARRERVVST